MTLSKDEHKGGVPDTRTKGEGNASRNIQRKHTPGEHRIGKNGGGGGKKGDNDPMNDGSMDFYNAIEGE
eukprot:CAMPEP_0194260708 /NCGR_PEP_ID=MMETSP0158-20130606/45651_1 /TAXON_ID=33649 /ORGANISM="Thalassionema nitzschioides, Strain L26-B" /LENGTH=68 /DNA_ID=CAMNT_0039000805 /DNA_START=466 /DNA_END=672 /DNA_ORIENTATION=+